MVYARYTGNGEFYNGIPARDLSAEEYAALSEEQKALVDSGRVYEIVKVARVEPPEGVED